MSKEITRLEGLYKNFLDELEYRNEEVDDEAINDVIKRCKHIYLHLQILEQMKDKCYLNKENYIKSKIIYDTLPKGIEIKDDRSAVYNYHISAIIDNINEIHVVEENNNESDLIETV